MFEPYPSAGEPPLPGSSLAHDHIAFLSRFVNPVYLEPRTIRALAARFVEESSLELHAFLCAPIAAALEAALRAADAQDGLGAARAGCIPPHDSGTASGAWTLKGPPHKWRYCVLQPVPDTAGPEEIVRRLQDELFPSAAFRAWMATVSSLVPLGYAVEARRFRPGLDYTLATSEEKEARLDVVLGLTPGVEGAEAGGKGKGKESAAEVAARGWEAGEWGGWEVCLFFQMLRDED